MATSSPRARSRASARTPRPRAGVRSLADDLRTRGDDDLSALLLARPDLSRPLPADLSALAARAATLPSIQRAVDALDAGDLAVLEALVVCGEPVDLARAAVLLGLSPARLRPRVDELWRRGLLWRGEEGTHLPRAVGEALGPHPAGLGPGPSDSPAIERAEEALREIDAPARDLLERLAWGPPVGTVSPTGPASDIVAQLVQAGLLERTAPDEVVLPRPAGLALRGGRLHPNLRLDPPPLPTRELDQERADAAGGAAAADLLGLIDEVAGLWGPMPPRVLRAGGLAVADLKATAQALDLDLDHAAFVIEIAYAAGLVDDDGEIEPVWAPTSSYDDWQQAGPEHRWLLLAQSWLRTTRAPSLVGRRPGRDERGAVNALSEAASTALGRAVRHDALALLASLPPGTAPQGATAAEPILARLRWSRPRRPAQAVADLGAAALTEAAWLGMSGYGALTTAGRLLAADADPGEAAAAIAASLPDPVDHVLLQADLTAVAPGRLEPRLAAFLRLAADVESRGGATVYRFTPASLRRPLDEGWDEHQLLDALQGASASGVPQPLAYLVGDVARRHGGLRVGAASSYVRSDDPLSIDDLVARRDLAAYRLRRLGPGVAVAQVAPATLLGALRGAGLLPVAESGEGAVVVPPRTHRRARGRRAPLPGPGSDPSRERAEEAARSAVATLRDGEDALMRVRSRREDLARSPLLDLDPAALAAFLRDAAAGGRAVWVALVDSAGASRRLRLRPTRLEGGRIHGRTDDDLERSYSLHRIAGVGPAQ